jgi:hypothetical protein
MRFAILTFIAASCLLAQSRDASPVCNAGGAVFGVDLVADGLLFKDPFGYIGDVDVPKGTPIFRLVIKAGETSGNPQPITKRDIHIGDLVCIEKARDSKIATRVTVVARTDIEQAQREFVAEWQTNTVFGTIMTIDAAGKKMTIAPVAPVGSIQPVIVDLSGDVQYRMFPDTALQVTDATTISLSDFQLGQYVFVRGKKSTGDSLLSASTVVKGGMRAIIATYLDSNPLQMTVKVREVGSGKNLDVRIPSGKLYRTTNQLNSPYRVQGPNGLMLDQLGFADLQPGDIVLIIGKADYNTGQGTGLALITRFGYFGTAPNGDKQQLAWFLK